MMHTGLCSPALHPTANRSPTVLWEPLVPWRGSPWNPRPFIPDSSQHLFPASLALCRRAAFLWLWPEEGRKMASHTLCRVRRKLLATEAWTRIPVLSLTGFGTLGKLPSLCLSFLSYINECNISTRPRLSKETEDLLLSHKRPACTLLETRLECKPLGDKEGLSSRIRIGLFTRSRPREEAGLQIYMAEGGKDGDGRLAFRKRSLQARVGQGHLPGPRLGRSAPGVFRTRAPETTQEPPRRFQGKEPTAG